MSSTVRSNLAISRKLLFGKNDSSIEYRYDDEQFEFKIGDEQVLCVGADGITCAGFPEPPYGVTVLNESIDTTITDVNISESQTTPLIVLSDINWHILKSSYWRVYPEGVSQLDGDGGIDDGGLLEWQTASEGESSVVYFNDRIKLHPDSVTQVTFSCDLSYKNSGTSANDFQRIGLFGTIPTGIDYPGSSIILEGNRSATYPDAWFLEANYRDELGTTTTGPFLSAPNDGSGIQTFRFVIHFFFGVKVDVYQMDKTTFKFTYIASVLTHNLFDSHFYFANQLSRSDGNNMRSRLMGVQIKTSSPYILYDELPVYHSFYNIIDEPIQVLDERALRAIRFHPTDHQNRTIHTIYIDSVFIGTEGGVNGIDYAMRIYKNPIVVGNPDWDNIIIGQIDVSEMLQDFSGVNDAPQNVVYTSLVRHPASDFLYSDTFDLRDKNIRINYGEQLWITVSPSIANLVKYTCGVNWHS